MNGCERGHGGQKKASGVPNIWRRLEHCMDPQSYIPTRNHVAKCVYIYINIYVLKRTNEKW